MDFQTIRRTRSIRRSGKRRRCPPCRRRQIVNAGDPVTIHVFDDPDTPPGLVDTVTVVPCRQMPLRNQYNGREWWQWVACHAAERKFGPSTRGLYYLWHRPPVLA